MSRGIGLLSRLDSTGVPLLAARLVVGGMFIWMGVAKIAEPVEFLKLVRQYQMIPDSMPWLLNATAAVLPWLEVFCGALLIAGVAVRGASLLALGLLAVFTLMVVLRAVGIYNDGQLAFCAIKFDCGCGSGEVFICRKLLENTGLALLTLLALLSRSTRFCLWRNLLPSQRLPWRIEGY